MTDDLEPRVRAHLRQRAGRVSSAPDVADLRQRLEAGRRRRTRAVGAVLALALIAGPVAGFAAARSTQPDRDTVSASGPGGGASSDGSSPIAGGVLLEGAGAGYLDPEMELVSERTTEAGVRLVVRSTVLGGTSDPCANDGLIRVGIADRQLIDVAQLETSPGAASFGVVGGADGRPMWVVVARAMGTVAATFPNGATDSAEAVDGIVVLAAYADDGRSAEELLYDVIQVDGLSGRPEAGDPRAVTIADGSAGCEPEAPVTPTMPEPGEPPADEEAARADITELFSLRGGADPHTQVDLHEQPDVWLDAQLRFQEQQPDYFEWSKEVYGVVDEIVFTAPNRATVRYSLVSDDPSVPAPGERIGEAVLIDGIWKVSIETSCDNLALGGIECDHSS